MVTCGSTEINLFGPVKISVGGVPVHLRFCGKTLDLFRYLLIHANRRTRREKISDAFWPTAIDARRRSALNSAIWRIRSAIAPATGLDLMSEGDAIQLSLSGEVRVDSMALEEAYDSANRSETPGDIEVEALFAALEGTDEPFLDGCDQEWAIIERERISEIRFRGMGLLMRQFGLARQYDQAINFGRKILAEDPFRESVHCAVMWLYVLSGRRAEAIRQYSACVKLLDRELGIEPMAELQAIRDYIGGTNTEQRLSDDTEWQRYESELKKPRAPLEGFLGSLEHSRLAVFSAICARLH